MSHTIDSIVKSYHQKFPEVGISVGCIVQGEEFYTGYGNLSKTSKIKVNKNSIFEIGSVTKIFTTNLIAQATLEKKLHPNDFIDTYLPVQYKLHPNLQQKIKISDLASHLSGLPRLNMQQLVSQYKQQIFSSITSNTIATLINNCEALEGYGTYEYSNVGYILLGQILEKAYGKTYEAILDEKIITPLQLSSTLTKNEISPYKTTGYNLEGGAQDMLSWNIAAPAGLIKSSASDMITYTKSILQADTNIGKAALLTEKIYYIEDGDGVGLGIIEFKESDNILYLKTGDSLGQAAILCYNRADNWGLVILLNHANSALRQQILNAIYGAVLEDL
jgi:CubicO group peptidase (beta-lactamase class C family)